MGTQTHRYAKTLTAAKVAERLSAMELTAKMAEAIEKGAVALAAQDAASAKEMTDKFRGEAFKGEMKFANMSTYYAGLSGLIGDPHMVDGSLKKVRALLLKSQRVFICAHRHA